MPTTKKYKYRKLSNGRSKATPRKDVVSFEDLCEDSAPKEKRGKTKKRYSDSRESHERASKKSRRRSKNVSKTSEVAPAEGRKRKKKEGRRIVKQVVKVEMSRFVDKEKDKDISHLAESICREFVTNICGDDGMFRKGIDSMSLGPKPNPKNGDLARRIKIMEEQLRCYEVETVAWETLHARIAQASEEFIANESSARGETISPQSSCDKSRLERQKKYLGMVYDTIAKADSLQRSLGQVETVCESALEVKKQLAKTFQNQMRHTLTMDSKTPRKLIKGMLE